MSMSFWSDLDKPGLNLSNVNACDLLRWLDYEPDYAGELSARDLAARCRRRLWPEARNVDAAVPQTESRGARGARFIECGREAGYLRDRTERLLAVAQAAGDGLVYYG